LIIHLKLKLRILITYIYIHIYVHQYSSVICVFHGDILSIWYILLYILYIKSSIDYVIHTYNPIALCTNMTDLTVKCIQSKKKYLHVEVMFCLNWSLYGLTASTKVQIHKEWSSSTENENHKLLIRMFLQSPLLVWGVLSDTCLKLKVKSALSAKAACKCCT
jgi:hypothetical protein